MPFILCNARTFLLHYKVECVKQIIGYRMFDPSTVSNEQNRIYFINLYDCMLFEKRDKNKLHNKEPSTLHVL